MTQQEAILLDNIAELSEQIRELYNDHHCLTEVALVERSQMLDQLIVQWHKLHQETGQKK